MLTHHASGAYARCEGGLCHTHRTRPTPLARARTHTHYILIHSSNPHLSHKGGWVITPPLIFPFFSDLVPYNILIPKYFSYKNKTATTRRSVMTPKRLRLIQLVHAYWHHHQMGPTLEELAQQTGVRSRSNVHMMITELIKQGWLAKTPMEVRGVALTEKGLSLCRKSIYIHLPPPPLGQMNKPVLTDVKRVKESA